MTAEFLGETKEAEHWLQTYDRKVKLARARLIPAVKDHRFLIVRISKQNLFVYCNRSMSEVFFRDLPFTPAYGCDRAVYDRPVSVEQLAEWIPTACSCWSGRRMKRWPIGRRCNIPCLGRN